MYIRTERIDVEGYLDYLPETKTNYIRIRVGKLNSGIPPMDISEKDAEDIVDSLQFTTRY